MKKDEQIQFWQESERQLKRCLELSQLKSEDGKSQVIELIEHDEHLLAFEELIGALHECRYEIDDVLARELLNFAERLHVDQSSPAHSILRNLSD
jgi:hypothetical protein